jgi:hypothetical protein
MDAADQTAGQTYALDAQACLAQQTEKNDRLCFIESIGNDNEDTSLIDVFSNQCG